MANFLQDYGITKKMTSDITDKPKINLFDFSQKPQITKPVAKPTIVPTTGKNLIQTYLDDENEDYDNRSQIFKMIENGEDESFIEDSIKNQIGYTGPDINKMGLMEESRARGMLAGESIKGRIGEVAESWQRPTSGNAAQRAIQPLGTALKTVGSTIGAGFDIAGQGLALAGGEILDVTPEFIKEGLTGTAKTAWEKIPESVKITAINAIKTGGEEYGKFKEQYPFLAEGLEGSANIASVIPVGFGAKKGTEVLKKGADTLVDTTQNIVKTSGKGLDHLGKKKEQVLSGLTKEQIAGLQSNPYQADEFVKMVDRFESTEGIGDIKDYKVERVGAVTKDLTNAIDELKATKGDTGPLYKQVRSLDLDLDPTETFTKIDNTLSSKGLVKNADGLYIPDGSLKSAKYSDTDIANINKFITAMNKEAINGTLKPNQVLDARDLSRIFAKYDATKTTEGMAIFQQLRRDINDTIRDKIPGLKELDEQFIEKLDMLDDATRDLVYKGGDIKGEWRSNIVNIIGTLDRANRAKLLERLDDVIPGIGEKIKAIDNIDTLYKSLGSKGVFEKFTGVGGAFAGASAMSGLPIVGPIIGAILGYTGGKILETSITAVRKKALQNVLNKISKDGLKRLEDINLKLEKKKLLQQKEKEVINSLKTKIKNEERNITNNTKPTILDKPMTDMNSSSSINTTSKDLKPKVLPTKAKQVLKDKNGLPILKTKKD